MTTLGASPTIVSVTRTIASVTTRRPDGLQKELIFRTSPSTTAFDCATISPRVNATKVDAPAGIAARTSANTANQAKRFMKASLFSPKGTHQGFSGRDLRSGGDVCRPFRARVMPGSRSFFRRRTSIEKKRSYGHEPASVGGLAENVDQF